jgi:hypothetical protein
MRSPTVGTAVGSGQGDGVWAHRLDATCLVLFPLLFLALAGTDLHPSPSGNSAADQLRAVAAPAAKACAASSPCRSPGNQPFLRKFADTSWNDVAHLSYAAGTLILSLATLPALGWMARTVRPWEALGMAVGVVGIYTANTALHGDAKYGLAFVLIASASIALRRERSSRHG